VRWVGEISKLLTAEIAKEEPQRRAAKKSAKKIAESIKLDPLLNST
jgi:hypothetical protein